MTATTRKYVPKLSDLSPHDQLPLNEAARYLYVSVRDLQELISMGEIPVITEARGPHPKLIEVLELDRHREKRRAEARRKADARRRSGARKRDHGR